MQEVTAALILKDGKILIAQRAENEKLAGKWEFPGGKIEMGETPEECLQREIFEEFDVSIEVGEFFDENVYRYETGEIKLLAYWAKHVSGEFILNVHSKIKWVGIDEMSVYDFAPADIAFVEKLSEIAG